MTVSTADGQMADSFVKSSIFWHMDRNIVRKIPGLLAAFHDFGKRAWLLKLKSTQTKFQAQCGSVHCLISDRHRPLLRSSCSIRAHTTMLSQRQRMTSSDSGFANVSEDDRWQFPSFLGGYLILLQVLWAMGRTRIQSGLRATRVAESTPLGANMQNQNNPPAGSTKGSNTSA